MSFVCFFFFVWTGMLCISFCQFGAKKQLFSCGDFQFQEAEAEIFVFVLWNGNNIVERRK